MRATKKSSRQVAKGKQLKGDAERLRIQFIDADLNMAMTFVQLASHNFKTGEPENGIRLIFQAQHAADKVAELLEKVSDDAPLRARLETLRTSIAEAKKIGAS